MKKTIVAAIALTSSLVANAEETVNVYTHRHYESDAKLFADFSKETGIKVNVVKAKADQLMQRLKAEGKNSPADLLITVDVARLYKAKKDDLLQSVKSDILEKNIPKHLKDKDNYWFGLTKRARVIVYNKDFVKSEELSTYSALTDKKWRNRLLVRSSTNTYNQSLVASIISHKGAEKTKTWCKELVANFARNPKGSDRDQMRAVAAGEADIAIVNTYYLGKLLYGNNTDKRVAQKLKIFFPNQSTTGTHINISGIGITKYSKNKSNALKLIEFLSGEKAQAIFAEANYEYPVNPNVKASSYVRSWGKFKEDNIELYNLGSNNIEAVKVMDKAGWK